MTKIKNTKERFCISCNASNSGNDAVDLYYCPKHKKIFCIYCMTNKSKVNQFHEVVHCHKTYFLSEFYNKDMDKYDPIKHDCIYEKIPILEKKEVQNVNN